MPGEIRRSHVDLHRPSELKVITSKLIVDRKRQDQRSGKVYEVIKSKDQLEVVAILAELFSEEDETFFENLVETDKRHLSQNPGRSRRYVWIDPEREGQNRGWGKPEHGVVKYSFL